MEHRLAGRHKHAPMLKAPTVGFQYLHDIQNIHQLAAEIQTFYRCQDLSRRKRQPERLPMTMRDELTRVGWLNNRFLWI
ncbi:hypothetical protein [Pseudomonas shirazensis]|uniref:hypothetical protein n=1 Tax=Pseudomonas shirazensis TaxID=2745494 RepID=UPI0039886B2D